METPRPSAASVRYKGRREMRNLAMSAVSALEQGGLRDLLDDLQHRVFDRDSEQLCDTERVDEGIVLFTYKPMVELLLREITDVMRSRDLSRDEQRTRVTWALDVAGF
jgi:hypothetical protein